MRGLFRWRISAPLPVELLSLNIVRIKHVFSTGLSNYQFICICIKPSGTRSSLMQTRLTNLLCLHQQAPAHAERICQFRWRWDGDGFITASLFVCLGSYLGIVHDMSVMRLIVPLDRGQRIIGDYEWGRMMTWVGLVLGIVGQRTRYLPPYWLSLLEPLPPSIQCIIGT